MTIGRHAQCNSVVVLASSKSSWQRIYRCLCAVKCPWLCCVEAYQLRFRAELESSHSVVLISTFFFNLLLLQPRHIRFNVKMHSDKSSTVCQCKTSLLRTTTERLQVIRCVCDHAMMQLIIEHVLKDWSK